MVYVYSIFSAVIISASLFAMNKKSTFQEPKSPLSYHMQPDDGTIKDDKDNNAIHTTYQYYDGSKSTYTTYNQDSSDKNKYLDKQ